LAVELGCGVVRVAIFFFVVGFGLALFDGVMKVGLGEGLERDEGEAEGGCGGIEAAVIRIGGLFSAVLEALEEKYRSEEREKGEKERDKEQIEVQWASPLWLAVARGGSVGLSCWNDRRTTANSRSPAGMTTRKATATAGKAWANQGAAMFSDCGESGLRGRGTLEEGGPNVAIWCKNVVLTWLVRDDLIDPLDEEEDRNQEEEGCSVMIRCVGEQEEYYGDDGCEGDSETGECLNSANF
jgi:hypothetical protein